MIPLFGGACIRLKGGRYGKIGGIEKIPSLTMDEKSGSGRVCLMAGYNSSSFLNT